MGKSGRDMINARKVLITTDAKSCLCFNLELPSGCQFLKYSNNLGETWSLCYHFLPREHDREASNDSVAKNNQTASFLFGDMTSLGKHRSFECVISERVGKK